MGHVNTPSFPFRELTMNSLGFRDIKQKDRKQRWTSERWCMFGGKARLGGGGGWDVF